MYLSEDTWRKNNVRKNIEVNFYTSAGNMFPNCLKYADELKKVAKEKEISVFFSHLITKIDKNNRVVTFKKTGDKEESTVDVNFDFLHFAPP